MDLRIAEVIGLTTRKDISRLSSACCALQKYELLQSAPQPALHPGVWSRVQDILRRGWKHHISAAVC
jgi:hypothetical protein